MTIATERFAFALPVHGLAVVPDAGTLLARDGDAEIRTPYDDCVLIMPTRRPKHGETAVRLGRFVGLTLRRRISARGFAARSTAPSAARTSVLAPATRRPFVVDGSRGRGERGVATRGQAQQTDVTALQRRQRRLVLCGRERASSLAAASAAACDQRRAAPRSSAPTPRDSTANTASSATAPQSVTWRSPSASIRVAANVGDRSFLRVERSGAETRPARRRTASPAAARRAPA